MKTNRSKAVNTALTLECGDKRSATPLWIRQESNALSDQKRRRRFALPAHSKSGLA
jgi:hypothetical protein